MVLPANRPCDSREAGRLIDKPRRRSNGQSIVEMTLLVPLVFATLYIPADFGVAFFTAHLVQNATREAARIGASMNPFVPATVEDEATKRLQKWKFVASSVSADLNGTNTSTAGTRIGKRLRVVAHCGVSGYRKRGVYDCTGDQQI